MSIRTLVTAGVGALAAPAQAVESPPSGITPSIRADELAAFCAQFAK